MGSYNSNYGNGDSSFFALRQADGKVLGRVRPGVKLSTPQPGMKDYRFFVDSLRCPGDLRIRKSTGLPVS